jgi:hypothetical protein
MVRRRLLAVASAAVAAALAAPAAAPAAEALVGVTSANMLVTFMSDSPGAVRHAAPITGLQEGESVLAIDVRPATGALYALGSSSRLYRLDAVSGVATPAGPAPFSPALDGSSFGFAFNPSTDRVRVTSDNQQNLRLDPTDGDLLAEDPALAYAPGDANFGVTPHVGAVAHTAETASRLFGIDSGRDVLVLQSPQNSGRLSTIGSVGHDLHEPLSFDFAADGRAYVSGRRTGGTPELFSLDLATGALSPAAVFSTLSRARGEIGPIATAGAVPDDTIRPAVMVDVERRQARRRLRTSLTVPVSCSEACDVAAVLLLGREIRASGTSVLEEAGRTRVTVTPNGRGRRLARGKRTRRLTLRVTAVDAAGNARTVRRRLTFK